MKKQENDFLTKKIQELEEKVDQLRFSRRVLMNLVEKIERDKWGHLSKLERENKKLQFNNRKFALSLLHKNRQIMELEGILKENSDRK